MGFLVPDLGEEIVSHANRRRLGALVDSHLGLPELETIRWILPLPFNEQVAMPGGSSSITILNNHHDMWWITSLTLCRVASWYGVGRFLGLPELEPWHGYRIGLDSCNGHAGGPFSVNDHIHRLKQSQWYMVGTWHRPTIYPMDMLTWRASSTGE